MTRFICELNSPNASRPFRSFPSFSPFHLHLKGSSQKGDDEPIQRDCLKAELDKPLALCREDFERSDYGKELQRLATNPDQLRRYWPLLLSLPIRDFPYWPERIREILTMSRAATLASVALEQYRRRVGEWPDRLEQLVPADLPRVPQDIFTGRPLNYRVIDGKPLMYSVFRDRDDDGGKPFPNSAVGYGPHDGDLRLLPAR